MDSQCAVCHKKNDQLLMLSCSHDPCIDCAATHYFAGAEFRREFQLIKEANYWCQVCFEPTSIDKTSISQLNLYIDKKYKQTHQTVRRSRSKSKSPTTFSNSPEHALHRYNKAKKKIKQSNVEIDKLISLASSQEILKSNYNLAHSQYGNQIRNSIKEAKTANQLMAKKNNCLYHDDELKNYYCFTCLQSICVQCALHGSHVGHQVEAVKKASTKLKVVYDNIMNESEKCRSLLQGNIKDIDKIIHFFKAWNEQQIALIKQKFKQLLDILIEKQQKILNQIQGNQKSEILKLGQIKKKQEQQINELKLQKKNLKKSIAVQSLYWNIEQIEGSKNQLNNLLKNTEAQPLNLKKMETDIQYVQTQIILEALDTIQQLVHSFKITLKNKPPLKKSDQIYFYKTT